LFLVSLTTGGALIAILKYNQPVSTLATNSIKVSSTANDKAAPVTNTETANNSTDNSATPATKLPAGNGTAASNANNSILPQATLNNSKDVNTNKDKTTSPDVTGQQPLSLNYAIAKHINQAKPHLNRNKQPKNKQGRPQRTTGTVNDPLLQRNNNVTTAPDKQLTASDRATSDDAPVNNDNTTAPDQPLPQNNTTTAADNKSTAADSAAVPVKETVKKDSSIKKKNTPIQRLEIGLLAGPDVSTVEFGPLDKTGYNFGLQIGYRLSNRWLLNTAIIYTKKFYKADSQYYKPKNNPWPSWDLENVSGNCAMWEIPVNVRYDVSYNDKRRWFVSTGLSTYLMTKENYKVNYSVNNNPYPYSYNSDSNSNYLFSIVNLSAGMERSLGKNFSIQAEPYLKIPLKGLGYGSMRMDSYGILFSLKYKPTFRSKQSALNK
jgi:outer membrane protein with beta-barrel domain